MASTVRSPRSLLSGLDDAAAQDTQGVTGLLRALPGAAEVHTGGRELTFSDVRI